MLNKPLEMRFIIADTTAVSHMGRGDFVRFPSQQASLSSAIPTESTS